MEEKSFPIVAVIAGVIVVGGIVAFVALRGGKSKTETITTSSQQSSSTTTSGSFTTNSTTTTTTTQAIEPIKPSGPSPDQIANEFARSLSRQRLWSDVEVVGNRVEIRSGACEEPAMKTSVQGVAPSFKTAGIARLRCLDKSGRPVFEQDL